jgi:hypothetical protein
MQSFESRVAVLAPLLERISIATVAKLCGNNL